MNTKVAAKKNSCQSLFPWALPEWPEQQALCLLLFLVICFTLSEIILNLRLKSMVVLCLSIVSFCFGKPNIYFNINVDSNK